MGAASESGYSALAAGVRVRDGDGLVLIGIVPDDAFSQYVDGRPNKTSYEGERITCTCRYNVMVPMRNGTLRAKPKDQSQVPLADSILRRILGSYTSASL